MSARVDCRVKSPVQRVLVPNTTSPVLGAFWISNSRTDLVSPCDEEVSSSDRIPELLFPIPVVLWYPHALSPHKNEPLATILPQPHA